MAKDRNRSTTDYYKSKSFWLETSGDSLEPRESLQKSITVDIAIMGAGFSGLWIAYYLTSLEPALNIAIIEREITGFGASGRNGGWCSPGYSVSPQVAIERYGKEQTRKLYKSMIESVREVGSIIEKEDLQVDWANNGSLRLALGSHNLPILEQSLEVYEELNLADNFQLLDKRTTERRIRVKGAEGSLLVRNSAVLNPGKLVRQLAHLLEKRGVKIYEQTPVHNFEKGTKSNHPQLITPMGTVQAKMAVVLTGESHISEFKETRRRIIPMYSMITLTEPLSDNAWNEIGWENRESVGSTSLAVDYLQRTVDGRILFGGRGSPYPYASKIRDADDLHAESLVELQEKVKRWFPILKNVKFTHSWGGPIGVTRDWSPNFIYNKETRIASAWGYAGQGVSTTNLAGRIITDLILEKNTEITNLPMVQHLSRNWEIEPFRWIGARYVQAGIERVTRDSEIKGIRPTGRTIAERLHRH